MVSFDGHKAERIATIITWKPCGREMDDTRIKLQVNPHDPRKVVDGTVVETDGVVISLATETPLTGTALQVITIYVDKSWLLQKLLDAVKTLEETQSQMGAKTFGIVACLDNELSARVTTQNDWPIYPR